MDFRQSDPCSNHAGDAGAETKMRSRRRSARITRLVGQTFVEIIQNACTDGIHTILYTYKHYPSIGELHGSALSLGGGGGRRSEARTRGFLHFERVRRRPFAPFTTTATSPIVWGTRRGGRDNDGSVAVCAHERVPLAIVLVVAVVAAVAASGR